MRVVFWDIETKDKPRTELEALLPDDLANPVMPYDLANPVVPKHDSFEHKGMSDPDKLKAWRDKKVLEWHSDHKEKITKWHCGVAEDRDKFYRKAALDPLTGVVKLIGMRIVEIIPPQSPRAKQKEKVSTVILCAERIDSDLAREFDVTTFDSEKAMLAQFWGMVYDWRKGQDTSALMMAGWNSNKFDLRFTRLRALANRVKVRVPITGANGYAVPYLWTDLMQEYNSGDKQAYTKITNAAKCLGIEGKELDGSQFGRLWDEDRRAALSYLRDDDLRLTEELGRIILPCF